MLIGICNSIAPAVGATMLDRRYRKLKEPKSMSKSDAELVVDIAIGPVDNVVAKLLPSFDACQVILGLPALGSAVKVGAWAEV